MMQLPIAKKSLGQHWLQDEESLDAMMESAGIKSGDTVLEIGPGAGTLTAKLVERASSVIAVEFDADLADGLRGRVDAEHLHVVCQDILRFDLTRLPKGYKVAANIPYYLTSNLLRVLCESSNPFDQAALLVQKEVAERVVARPGAMSLLSVSVQFYCEASLGNVVPAELFVPPPKVDSQILVLKYRRIPLFKGVDTRVFFRLVKAGFSARRKKLRSSLSGGLRLSKPEAEAMLTRAGISPDRRAQELSLDEWHTLYLEYWPTVQSIA